MDRIPSAPPILGHSVLTDVRAWPLLTAEGGTSTERTVRGLESRREGLEHRSQRGGSTRAGTAEGKTQARAEWGGM